MAKDRTGKFHPGKGKPSGINKEEGLDLHPTAPDKLDDYLELSDKYTEGEDELSANVRVMHPNRNTSKGEDQYKGKPNVEESNKSEYESASEPDRAVIAEELPGVLTKELFTELANFKHEHCVSLFLGTHRAGVEVNEQFDPVTVKRSLQDITTQLSQKGFNKPAIEKILDPVNELIGKDDFWKTQSNGLALFISDGFFKYIRMPLAPEQQLVIENSFYVTPLIPIMTSKEYFYLVVISKKQVKLFRGDAFGLEFIPVEGLPQGMDDLSRDDKGEEGTFRNEGPAATTGTGFHGMGGGNNVDEKAKIATYFEAADDVIYKKILHNENAPLVLAGVEYLIPIYKSVADYNNVWDDALTGNYEYKDTPTLYKEAKETMSPYFERRINKALELYGNQSATALTSSIPADVIPGTYYSRVSYLFVQKGAHIWGTFDEMSNEIKLHETQQEDSEDLIDNAVVKTLATGGDVFVLEKEKMPADSTIAAIFRY
jgi:hypothetical protein